ncbi:MAG: hypothetical protein U1C53_01875, partial [Candidatus Veblenbacteria bacterium]|nr:hypothetical protein [Candidatus Veblenbacteria bacterium]
MSKKLLIVAVAFALAATAVGIWWFTRPAPSPAVVAPSTDGTESAPPSLDGAPQEFVTPPSAADQPPLSASEQIEATLSTTAAYFAEAYGSYSSDANFENLKVLEHLYTSAFRQRVEAAASAAQAPAGFYGVTTKALAVTAENQTGSSAVALVTTQRQELF